MREPKPLGKEDREKIERLWSTGGSIFHSSIRDLLADAQYWREAVKNSVGAYVGVSTTYCSYCRNGISGHKPDCAWVKAQE